MNGWDPPKTRPVSLPSDVAIGETTVYVGKFANRSPAFRAVRLATGPYPGRISLLGGLALIAGVLDAIVLYAVARLALLLTDGADDSAELSLGPFGTHELTFESMLVVTGCLLLAVAAINLPIARVTGSLCRATLLRSRRRMLAAYLRASWSYRSTHHEGRLQEYMMNYCNKSEGVVLQISTVIVMLWSLASITLAAFVLAGWAAFGGLVGLAAIALVLRPLTKRIKERASVQATLNRRYSSTVAQTARVAPEIATFAVADEVTNVGGREMRPTGDAIAQLRFLTKAIPTMFQYSALAVVVGLIYVVYRFELGDLAVIGPLVILLMRALGNTKQLQTAMQAIVQNYPYVDDLENEIVQLNGHPMPLGSVPLERVDVVRLDDVGFEYVPGQPVLNHVDMTIRQGEAVGIVGPSGGGKSTLSQLLMGLRSPTSGRVSIGDVDLNDATVSSWGRLAALVPQDNSLIRASVADNIRFFRPDFTDLEVAEAARAAHLHDDIVNQLPDGYETLIGPGERQLSGGQRQRLGIARALLGQPSILVLDEPTSALDEYSENLIRQTLQELKGTRTLIIIAHRPSTLRVCDRVFRVEHGVVAELPQTGQVLVDEEFDTASELFDESRR